MKAGILSAFLISATIMSSCADKKGQIKLDYEKYTLDNGLEVVLHQDTSDPVVSVAIQYNVGSKNEKPGKTGFAHFFEHMLFQRSEHLPRNAFFQKIDELGGTFNGGTSNDGTIYYETVPRNALEKVLWMESDRMGYFINTVTQGGLEREIDVVSNEKRQYENAPYGMANDLLFKNLFPEGHPYSWTVIGEIPDLRSATVEDVKEFYDKYYTPSNATLAIAGDFDPAQVKELINKYFGEIPARPTPEKMEVRTVTLDSVKNIYYEDIYANAPMEMLAYPGVEAYNPDGYALDFLTNILASDKKSPLYKVLVEERKLMPSVSMYSFQLKLAGAILVEGTTFPGVDIDDVYDGIMEAFARFEKEGVNPKDLERYKLMEETRTYNRLTSTNGKAMAMASDNVFAGKPDRSLDELEHYRNVTPEDVMRVYDKYIKGRNHLNISIVPAGAAELAYTGSVAAAIDQESIEEQELNSEAGAIIDDPYEMTPSKLDRSVEPGLMSNVPVLTPPQIWTRDLPNGMTVKGIAYNELPLVYFAIELNDGMLRDTPGKEGLANFTATMLNEGTANRTPEELEEAIGQLGARINVTCSNEYMSLSGNCLKDNFEEVMSIVEEMLLQPRWDENSFNIVKQRIIDDICQNATQPGYIAERTFRRLLFGAGNILSSTTKGTVESVNAITMDDLKGFYNSFFSPSIAKMSYVGGHTTGQVEKILAPLTESWKNKEVPELKISLEEPAHKAKIYFVDYPDARQSYILIGDRSMAANSPDAYKAVIVNDKLGASSNGILFEVLRLQRGYTYGAYSYFLQGKYINYFSASSSVQALATKESAELFRDILTSYRNDYSQTYLDGSTSSMLRKLAGSFETPDALLGMLRGIFILDRPDDYIKQRENTLQTITLAEAKEVIGKYINYDDMIVVVVGDAKTQFAPLKNAGLGEAVLIEK